MIHAFASLSAWINSNGWLVMHPRPCKGCQCSDKQVVRKLPSHWNRAPKPKCSWSQYLPSTPLDDRLTSVHKLGHEPAKASSPGYSAFVQIFFHWKEALLCENKIFECIMWTGYACKLAVLYCHMMNHTDRIKSMDLRIHYLFKSNYKLTSMNAQLYASRRKSTKRKLSKKLWWN